MKVLVFQSKPEVYVKSCRLLFEPEYVSLLTFLYSRFRIFLFIATVAPLNDGLRSSFDVSLPVMKPLFRGLALENVSKNFQKDFHGCCG